MNLTIRTKLLFSFSLTILLSIFVTCFILALQARNSAVAEFHSSTSNELSQIDRGMTIFMDKALKMTNMLAQSEKVRELDESIHSFVAETRELMAADIVRSELEKISWPILN
ncbi:hypothetical protein MASR1M90_12650 [Desulfovibrionales bacterium]